jgi:chromosome segregation ATPase
LLEQKQRDNEQLKGKLQTLESKMGMMSIESRHSSCTEASNALQLTPSIENDLIDEVRCLAARLDVMEDERKEMAVRYEDELRQKESEIHEVVAMVRRAKEKQQHRKKERVVVTQVSAAEQELDKLQRTLREKDAEIDKLKGRVNEGPTENSPSGLCGFSPCDLSHCFCS